jgi:hypothetical protein
MTTVVDLRCPVFPKALFARLRSGEAVIRPGSNLIEVSCRDCRNAERAQNGPCTRVLHRFNVLGEHVETQVVP